MTLNVPSQYETILHDAVASGAFACPEEALRHALELLAIEQTESQQFKPRTQQEHEEWSAKFRAWVNSHSPVNHFVDDSRESIYEGRGE